MNVDANTDLIKEQTDVRIPGTTILMPAIRTSPTNSNSRTMFTTSQTILKQIPSQQAKKLKT